MDKKLVWAQTAQSSASDVSLGSYTFDSQKVYLLEAEIMSASSFISQVANVQIQVDAVDVFPGRITGYMQAAVYGTPTTTAFTKAIPVVAAATLPTLSGSKAVLSKSNGGSDNYAVVAVRIFELI